MDFDWDNANEGHCRRHDITRGEVEHVIASGIIFPNAEHSQTELRFRAIGRTPSGRWAYASFTIRGERVRPVTAHFLHEKEVQKWLKR